MKKNILKYHTYFVAIFLTAISFFIEQGCSDLLCIFGGRGYPIPFYNQWFVFWFFAIDVLFWWIVYTVVFIIIKVIRNPKILKKGTLQ